MHYYKKNIGDYHKKAGRLSMLQHGAYTLLMDACYDREQFPTVEEAIDWTWASTNEEIEAVKFVLHKFFKVDDDGKYYQQRIKEELEKYHNTSETNKRIAIEREAKRKQKSTKRARDVNEPPPNHKPLTNNHNKYSHDSYEIAAYLEERIISENPKAKTNSKKWAIDIDRAIRIDGRTKEELMNCINWIYFGNGKFWIPNILSGEKLRKQYDTLFMQMQNKRNEVERPLNSSDLVGEHSWT